VAPLSSSTIDGGAPPAEPNPDSVDRDRPTWRTASAALTGRRIALAIEIAMIALWFVIRTRYGVDGRPYLAWTVIAAAIAVVSPLSGLVLLAATAPFYEPTTLLRTLGIRPAPPILGFRHVLVAALALAVAGRLVLGGWRRMPWSRPVVLALVVAAVTLAGLGVSIARFDSAFGRVAAHTWLASIGGAMLLLIVAVWVTREGSVRPVIAAGVGCSIAALLSLVELVRPGSISEGALAWIGFWKPFGPRVSGIIPAPNAVATMLIVPGIVGLAAGLGMAGLRRVVVLGGSALTVAATVLTLSRSAIAGLYLTAVVVLGRRNRRAGWIALIVGGLVAAVSIPLFIQFRAGLQGIFAAQSPLDWILGADEARLTAWGAAARMFADAPLIGHGFLSYKELAPAFGDPRLGSPHNEVLRLFAEEGIVGGLAILAFIAALVRQLARMRDPVGTAILCGAIAYWFAALFNNPLLFIQVSAVAFTVFGFGLARTRLEPAELRPSSA
jgi:O-antigen ligase